MMPRLPTWEPSSYPDPAVHVLHEDFERYRVKHAGVDRIATGFRWSEGPVWFGDMRCLLWSDIPNNRMMRWDEETEAVTVFRKPSNFANGNTRDPQGRLITCEHGTRRVTRTEHDGTITVLMDSHEGRRLNSPNDVVVKSDGTVWFTDPAFGIGGDYEGHPAEPELPTNVYRLDPESEQATVVAGDIAAPNGLAFSPDESVLYVVQSLATPPNILAFDVTEDGTALAGGRVLIDAGPGHPDGLRCDQDGNLWCGWGLGDPELDGVMVFRPDGERIGRIQLPERCANLTFGGPHRNRLFMAASRSIYALYVNTRGLG
jgi:gluconolactonase